MAVFVALMAAAANAPAGEKDAPRFDAEAVEFFEKQVRPLLVNRCYECHGPEARRLEGGLLMNSRAALLAGGDTGPAVVPGKPKESLLIDSIHYGGLYEMPPKGKMPAAEIAILTRWVEMGAPWAESPSSGPDPRAKFDLEARRRSHWAWQPAADPAVPKVKDKAWPLDPIDHFILARLEAASLQPNPPADAPALVRRLHFDLIGLPPTAEEVADFESRIADWKRQHPSRSAIHLPQSSIEELVDRLLASPHFGERWGRHWLDLVRYAESRGHEFDYDAPNAWEYRDYVIRALNAGVPYDQFVVEQIAGDLLESPRRHPDEGYNESIIGTGFWHLGEWLHSPVDTRQDECERQENQLDTFGKAFLGMTIACARCHDHKFDAISQRDYYALAGYLRSSGYRLARFETLEHNRRIAEKLHKLREQSGRELAQRTLAAKRPVLEKLDRYLLAAREAILAPPADAREKAEPQGADDLNAALLAAWVAHLKEAKDRADDPLHLWARLAHEKEPDERRVAEIVRPILQATAGRRAAAESALAEAEIIVDYGNCDAHHWMTDGSAFGAVPLRTGQPLFSGDPRRPLAGFAIYGAARRDLAFAHLKLAPGSMNDQGKIGQGQRAGQSIRTPTFTVGEGRVHYLVRGAGRALAVVDSHLMIQGPLHGEVLLEWNDDGKDRPRWVTHNLSRHQGRRAHVEFSPRGDGALEILMVAQAGRAPGMPFDSSGAGLLSETFENEETSLESAAAAYRRILLWAVSFQLSTFGDQQEASADAAGGFAEASRSRDAAVLADWIVKHPELFHTGQAAKEAEELAEIAKRFRQQEQALAAQIKSASRAAMAMWDGDAEDERLLIRGNHNTPGDAVPRRLLAALGGKDEDHAADFAGSGRLALARKVVDPANPLTARVMANRVWHHLTGRGIVASCDNFGVLGEEPTHPELLDHLARRFVREGWSLKRLIKAIVLSRTYQMSSTPTEDGRQIDPANELLHRMRVRRLEGEAVRDALLTVSGRLDRKMYGPSVPVHLTGFMTGRGRPGQSGPLDGAGRRSIYIAVRRNFLSPTMLAFDMPQPSTAVGRRTVSNVPAQALILMNDPLVVQQAELWARRLLAEEGLSPQERIDKMYVQAFARRADESETAHALAFLSEQAARHGIPPERAHTAVQPWADLCHVMFNVKEFIFVR